MDIQVSLNYCSLSPINTRHLLLAILYNNVLFILFGVNQKGITTNDLRFLSLNNQTAYTWLKSYNPNNTGLSKHVIIGLSVGIFVAVSLIVLISVSNFFYMK